MKLRAAIAAAGTAALLTAIPAYAMDNTNVSLEIGAADLCATVPLCTYWYNTEESRGITPDITITNFGAGPFAVTEAKVQETPARIPGIPCTVPSGGQVAFALMENPNGSNQQERAMKYALVFTLAQGDYQEPTNIPWLSDPPILN